MVGLVVVLAAGVVAGLVGLNGAGAATGCNTDTYDVADSPQALATADFNDDGHPDVVTVTHTQDVDDTNTVSVLLNDGNGEFEQATSHRGPLQPEAVAAADLDGDDLADLAIANTLQNTVSVMRGQGDGTFAPPVDYPTGAGAFQGVPFGPLLNRAAGIDPVDVVAADLDGDDAPELATANQTSGDVSVLANTGNGAFAGPLISSVGDAPRALAAGDLDGDDHSDLAVAVADEPGDPGGQVAVLSGNGDATFDDPADPSGEPTRHPIRPSHNVVTADLNGDDQLDVATSGEVLFNPDGDGFQDPTHQELNGNIIGYVAAADLDGDDLADLAITESFSGEVSLLANAGDGTFTPLADCAAGDGPVGVAADDVDGDDRAEVLTPDQDGNTVSVMTPPTNPGRVTGTVTDADSGAPLESADVSATPVGGDESAATTRTGDDGTYTLSELETGDYTVTADHHDDYQPQSQTITVGTGETVTDVDFALQRDVTGAVAGRVTAAHSDDPLSGAQVTVTTPNGDTTATTKTSDDGSYVIDGLPAGEYTVTADYPDYKTQSTQATVTTDATTTGVDLALPAKRGAVAGTVTDTASGEPVAGGEVTVTADGHTADTRDGETAGVTQTGDDGTYTLDGLAVGDYAVHVDADGYQLQRTQASVTVAVDEATTVNFSLARDTVACTQDHYDVDSQPAAVATADVNDDDHPDVITANQDADTVSVLLNDGTGAFGSATSYPTSLVGGRVGGPNNPVASPRAVVVTDLDGDNTVDIAVANWGADSVAVLVGEGDGTFADPMEYPTGVTIDGTGSPLVDGLTDGAVTAGIRGVAPTDLVAVDVDGDGDRDLATANFGRDTGGERPDGSGGVTVLFNTGAATFAGPRVTTIDQHAQALTADHIDGDDHPDLAVATTGLRGPDVDADADEVVVLAGNGDGTFEVDSRHDRGDADPTGVALDDFDGDSDLDLATAERESNTLSVLTTTDDGGFAAPVRYQVGTAPADIVAVDLTEDGHGDLATANGDSGDISILPGAGDATFAGGYTDCPAGDNPQALATADLDNDGHTDLVTANQDSDSISVVDLTPIGRVAGTVTDADSGEPISQAQVTATPRGDDAAAETAETDADGTYSIRDLEPATYTVTTNPPNYQAQSKDVTVTAGETTPVHFALAEPADSGSVAGTVSDADSGDALEGAQVTVADASGDQVDSATTDSAGGYEVAGLGEGDYTVTADADGYQAQSKDVTVTAGETTTADFALTPEESGTGPGDDDTSDDAQGTEETDDTTGTGDGDDTASQDDGTDEDTTNTQDETQATSESTVTQACPDERVPAGGFTDVDGGSVHADAIDCVAWYAISLGTSETTYTPAGVTTRAQMAAFIARTMETGGVDLGEPGDQGFDDTNGHPLKGRINQLAAAGVVQGTSATTYHPQAPVTRAQMASFLVRAYEATTGEPLPAGEDSFIDTDGSVHADNIAKAAEAGWAKGISAERYDPSGAVRRDQQASFLARLLNDLVAGGFATHPDQA